jgi:hypothetical protein
MIADAVACSPQHREAQMSAPPSTVPPEAAAAQLGFQIALGYMASSALHAALELGIPDRLAAGPKPVAELARDTNSNEDALYRVLRVLASVGLFEEQAPRTFAANQPALMLQRGPGSARDMLHFISDPHHFRIHAELLHSVRTGQPALEKVMGAPAFEVFAADKAFGTLFNNAMTSMSAQVIPAVLEAFDFGDIKVLVDIAGGHGRVLTSILQRYPAMRGVLFDLDHVIAGASPLIAEAGVGDRCTMVAGNFFKAVPAGGDAYIMKNIIHDWDDARATAILGVIHQALRDVPRGRVILLESVIRPGNEPDFGKFLDIEMLVAPGGRERTADEFRTLFDRAGFDLARIVPTASPLCGVEAVAR